MIAAEIIHQVGQNLNFQLLVFESPMKELRGDKKSLFLFRNTVCSFISRYDAFWKRNWESKLMFYLPKLTTKKLHFLMTDGEVRGYDAMETATKQKKMNNVEWNDLSFDIYLYNEYLEMLLRRCRFIFT